MPLVNLPNGTALNFPDDMSQDDMRSAIQKNFPDMAPKPGIIQDVKDSAVSSGNRVGRFAENLDRSLYGGFSHLANDAGLMSDKTMSDIDDENTKAIGDNLTANKKDTYQPQTLPGKVTSGVIGIAPMVAGGLVGGPMGAAAVGAMQGAESGFDALDNGASLSNAQLHTIGSAGLNTLIGGVISGGGEKIMSKIGISSMVPTAVDSVASYAKRAAQNAVIMPLFKPAGAGLDYAADALTDGTDGKNYDPVPGLEDPILGALLAVPHSTLEYVKRNKIPLAPTSLADGSSVLTHSDGALFSSPEAAQNFINKNELPNASPTEVTHKLLDPNSPLDKTAGYAVKITASDDATATADDKLAAAQQANYDKTTSDLNSIRPFTPADHADEIAKNKEMALKGAKTTPGDEVDNVMQAPDLAASIKAADEISSKKVTDTTVQDSDQLTKREPSDILSMNPEELQKWNQTATPDEIIGKLSSISDDKARTNLIDSMTMSDTDRQSLHVAVQDTVDNDSQYQRKEAPQVYLTRKGAEFAKIQNDLTGMDIVDAPEGKGYMLYPKETIPTEVERNDARRRVEDLNRAIAPGGTKGVVLSDKFDPSFGVAKTLAGVFGFKTHIVSASDQFNGVAHNGDLFLSENSNRPALEVAGHEVTHLIEGTQYHSKLSEVISDYLHDDAISNRKVKEDQLTPKDADGNPRNGGISLEGAKNEVIADINGKMWLDPRFWREMIQRDPNLFRQVAYHFAEVTTKGIEGLRGARVDASMLVKDQEAVMKLMAQTWADHLQSNPDAGSLFNDAVPFLRKKIGDFDAVTNKDGSILIKGKPEEIRNLLPEDVRGREFKDGLLFTHSDGPRVQAALEGNNVAYGRQGRVIDKLPMKDGKYIGAPEKYNKPGNIGILRGWLGKLTDEGTPGRYWYENSSREILRMVGGNLDEARKFVALLAIYSPQAKVDTNSTFALRAWSQYKAGEPIKVKTGVMDSKAKEALDNVNKFWSGEKTGNFFNNLLSEIDPATKGKQGATIDMWMMRAARYASDAPNANQYSFMENEINRIAAEKGWEPQQVQAAIWVAMKARMENKGVKSETEALSAKKKWIRYDENNSRVILDAQKHRDNWLDHSFEHDPTTDDTNKAKFDFSDGVQRHLGQVSFEARPGRTSGILPGIHDAPYHEQLEYQHAFQNALYDADGNDLLAHHLGLLVDNEAVVPGVWQNEISPSNQKAIAMAPALGPDGKYNVDPSQRKLLNVYASVLGLLGKQEGVGWHRPFYSTTQEKANGVNLDLGREITPEETKAVSEAVGRWMADNGKGSDWNDSLAFVSSLKGLRIINFGVISNKELHSSILKAIEPELPSLEARMFASDGDMPSNNWKDDTNGEDYTRRIRAEGRPDVLGWARDILAPRVQLVNDEFSKKYGWGDPGQFKFSRKSEDESPQFSLKDDDGKKLTAVFGSLMRQQGDNVFRYPKSESDNLKTIANEVSGGKTIVSDVSLWETRNPGETMTRLEIRVPTPEGVDKSMDAFVSKLGNDVWINVAGFKKGNEGSLVYAIVGNWAYNNGYRFIGDPAGLSNEALIRRLQNMLSLSLKFGSTDFVKPHQRQIDKLEDFGFKWTDGDDQKNLQSMLYTTYNVLSKMAPELQDVEYNFRTNKFEENGQRFTDEDFLRAANKIHALSVRGAPGSGTLKIGATISTIVRGMGNAPMGESSESIASRFLWAIHSTGMAEAGGADPRSIGYADLPDLAEGEHETGLQKALYSRKQEETPEFKEWFGDSKVVDAEGKPLVVYHGSVNRDVNEFDTSRITTRSAKGDTPGTYFTDSPNTAYNYTRLLGSKDPRGSVTSAYLTIENPLNTTADIKRLLKKGLTFNEAKTEALKSLTPENDGIIFNGNSYNPPEYVVFKSNQIKSATANNGDFSQSNNDIRYSLKDSAIDHAKSLFDDIKNSKAIREAGLTLIPMSMGDQQAKSTAQKFANALRLAQHQWQTLDGYIATHFNKTQREAMWNAADEQNTLLQQGKSTKGQGLDSLPPDQRAVVQGMHDYSTVLFARAKAAGMVQGDGMPFWTPRMAVLIGEDGEYSVPSGNGKSRSNDGVGGNLSTSSPNLKQRKYLTAAETEAAMKSTLGDNAELVRDARTMPLAMARLEQAIAGRELVNQVKDFGLVAGSDLVSTSKDPGFVTIDHPALMTYKPRFDIVDGKPKPLLDMNDNIVMDRVPLFIHPDWEGPLRSVLSKDDGAWYRGYMLLKSKAMSAIMVSPLTHNMVIMGRALAYDPLQVLTLRAYFTGNALARDSALVGKAISSGLVFMGGNRSTVMDITDVSRGIGKTGGWGDINESIISKSAEALANVFSKGSGESIKAKMDAMGEFYHHDLLWKQVGALQMYIFNDYSNYLMDKGHPELAANAIASHLANRYGGAVARENMGYWARKALNVLLFSRSFNVGNIGAVKDTVYGLPAGLAAKIYADVGNAAGDKAMKASVGKARMGIAADLGMSMLLTAVTASAIKSLLDDETLDDIGKGYIRRFSEMGKEIAEHPMNPVSYNPYQVLPTNDNEEGKKSRIDIGSNEIGQHEYIRLPAGKVVEDTIGWLTEPFDTFKKKESPIVHSVWQAVTDDQGFGKPVKDPEGNVLTNISQSIGHVLKAQIPYDSMMTIYDMTQGVGTKLDAHKTAGFITGFSASEGNQRGPEGAIDFAVADRIKKQQAYAMDEVKRDLKYGKEESAADTLEKIGLTPMEINKIIRHQTSPQGGESRKMIRDFNMHSTDKEQELKERLSNTN